MDPPLAWAAVSTGLMWFRRDFRVDDNPALDAATAAHDEVVACFVVDPVPRGTAGPMRWRQLVGFLGALDDELAERGGRLVIVEGDPAEKVPRLVRELGAETVHISADATPYSRRRDDAVASRLADQGVGLEGVWSNLVHPPGTVLTTKGGLSRVFTPFHRTWSATAVPSFDGPGDGRLVAPDAVGGALPTADGPPPLDPSAAAVAARVEDFAGRVERYPDERDRLDLGVTSGLSVDLRWGAVSPHSLVRRFGGVEGGGAFVRQIAWRDWYAHTLFERPDMADRALRDGFDDIAWRNEPGEIDAWYEGRTGYPIVDAAMRELLETGTVHNRARLIAGSFLIKDLLVDWRIGERWYRHHLIDLDLASNSGNWRWVAGTGADAAPYFRIMNPLTQSRRFDPTGTYLRRYLPELAGLDDDAIHWPIDAGPLALAAAGVELGVDYPYPIVDHAEARQRCLSAYGATD